MLDLQEIAYQYKCKNLSLPQVILQLPEVFEYEVHVHATLNLCNIHDILRKILYLLGEVPAVFQIVAEPFGPVVLHIK